MKSSFFTLLCEVTVLFYVVELAAGETPSTPGTTRSVPAIRIPEQPIPPQYLTDDELPKYRIGEMEGSIGFYQAIEMVENSLLYSKQSQFQAIEVHQSKFFGKMLVLDGVIQLTERDADSYNEMMAHVGMFQHPNPKRVLLVGGGDGYVLKEVRE